MNGKLMFAAYPDLVDRYYSYNPDTEFLIPDGGGLENGMVVLVAAAAYRYSIVDMSIQDIKSFPAIMDNNRWCKVTQVEKRDKLVSFTGVYSDGSTAKRVAPKVAGWLVKKDVTDPTKMIVDALKKAESQRYEHVLAIVKESLGAGDTPEELTKKILKVVRS